MAMFFFVKLLITLLQALSNFQFMVSSLSMLALFYNIIVLITRRIHYYISRRILYHQWDWNFISIHKLQISSHTLLILYYVLLKRSYSRGYNWRETLQRTKWLCDTQVTLVNWTIDECFWVFYVFLENGEKEYLQKCIFSCQVNDKNQLELCCSIQC